MFEKAKILMPYSGLETSKLKIFQQNLRVGYMYIEELFDTIFNMGYGSSGQIGFDALYKAYYDKITFFLHWLCLYHLTGPKIIQLNKT